MSGSDKRSTSDDLNPSSLKRVRVTPLSGLSFLELIDRAVDAEDGSVEKSDLLARATERFTPSTDDINRHVDVAGASVLWFACQIALEGEPALLEKIIAGWDDLGVKPNINLTQLRDDDFYQGASVLMYACKLANDSKPELLTKIIASWDELEPKPNLNLFLTNPHYGSHGWSVLWYACYLASEGMREFLEKIIANWDDLDPKPNINLNPLHEDDLDCGCSVLWKACEFADSNWPELLDRIIAKWDDLDPQPNINAALFYPENRLTGVSVLWYACRLAQEDKPALLEKIITKWDGLDPKPNLNLALVSEDMLEEGVSVFWFACDLAKIGNAALLEKIIASWDQLDPKPDLNVSPVCIGHPLENISAFVLAIMMGEEGRPDLLNFLLSNWFSLEPRVNLESCQKEKLPAGLHATLVGLDRIKVIIETDAPSEPEQDELSSLIDQFAKFMCSDSPYKKPLVEGFVEYLSSQGQREIKAAFISDLRESDYPIFPSLILESVMATTVKTDFVIQDALRKAVAAYLLSSVDDESIKHIFREKIKRLRLKLAGSKSLVALPKAYNEEFDEFLQAQDELATSTDYLERLNAMMISAQDVSILKRLVARELSKAVADGAGAAAGSGAGAGAGSSTPFCPQGARVKRAIYLTCQENKL